MLTVYVPTLTYYTLHSYYYIHIPNQYRLADYTLSLMQVNYLCSREIDHAIASYIFFIGGLSTVLMCFSMFMYVSLLQFQVALVLYSPTLRVSSDTTYT